MIEIQEILTNSPATSAVPTRLSGFDNYQAFLNFSQSLFRLKPEEYQGLFNVLLKLESIGQDAVETMRLLKGNTDENELIRFMIRFDSMDMADIQPGFLMKNLF